MAGDNLSTRFASLVATQARQVAVVEEVHGDGTSTVQAPTGSYYRVEGTDVPVGQPAWIEDRRIVGAAPDMPVYPVDV